MSHDEAAIASVSSDFTGPASAWRQYLCEHNLNTIQDIENSALTKYPICLKVSTYDDVSVIRYTTVTSQLPSQLRPLIDECNGLFVDTQHPYSVVCCGFRRMMEVGGGKGVEQQWNKIATTVAVQQKYHGVLVKYYFNQRKGQWQLGSQNVPDLVTNSKPGQYYNIAFVELSNSLVERGMLNRQHVYLFELLPAKEGLSEQPHAPYYDCMQFSGIVHMGTIDLVSGLEMWPTPDIGVPQPHTFKVQGTNGYLSVLRDSPDVIGLTIVRKLKRTGAIVRTKFTARRHTNYEFRLGSLNSDQVLHNIVRLLGTHARYKFDYALPEEHRRNFDAVHEALRKECEQIAPQLEQEYRANESAGKSAIISAMTARWFELVKDKNPECMNRTPESVCRRVLDLWLEPAKQPLSPALLLHALESAPPPTVTRLVASVESLPMEVPQFNEQRRKFKPTQIEESEEETMLTTA